MTRLYTDRSHQHVSEDITDLPGGPSGGVSDGDKGDITVTNSGATWTIDPGVVSTAKMGGDVTTAGKALLNDADAAAQRTTLGLGTLATQSGNFSGTSSGTNTGDQNLAPYATTVSVNTGLSGKSDTGHGHAESEITGLVTDLAGKAASVHSHAQSEVTNLTTDLAGKAASIHSHAQSEVTNLTTDLAAKQATLVSGTNIKTINGSSVLGAGNLVVGGGASINTLKKTANQTINAGAGVFTDITDLTFPVVSGTDYAFDFYITFQSAATTTGWRAGVNCPAGTLDFWAGSDVIANGAAGVATHTERHNTVRDDMTLLTATITQAVDLNVRIRGRYLCTANGTFAARFANELVSNTQIVVQKGSWGLWF